MKLLYLPFSFTTRPFPYVAITFWVMSDVLGMSLVWIWALISIILMWNYNSYLMKINATTTKKLVFVMLLVTLVYSACNGNCVSCNSGTCEVCADGWDPNNDCATCDVGYYSTQGICALCLGTIENCLECSDDSTCTLCLDGYGLDSNCATCDSFYFMNSNQVC